MLGRDPWQAASICSPLPSRLKGEGSELEKGARERKEGRGVEGGLMRMLWTGYAAANECHHKLAVQGDAKKLVLFNGGNGGLSVFC